MKEFIFNDFFHAMAGWHTKNVKSTKDIVDKENMLNENVPIKRRHTKISLEGIDKVFTITDNSTKNEP